MTVLRHTTREVITSWQGDLLRVFVTTCDGESWSEDPTMDDILTAWPHILCGLDTTQADIVRRHLTNRLHEGWQPTHREVTETIRRLTGRPVTVDPPARS